MTDSPDIAIAPLGANLGAEIAGPDLTAPLSRESVRAVEAAMLRYKVLLNEIYDLMDSQAVRWEHQWRVGDTIMWENRSGLMHSGRLDYPRNEARTFLRTTVRGAPIETYFP